MLLRYRTAARLGRTVEEFEELPHVEQCRFLAVAMLDGWGEEWQRVSAMLHNDLLRVAGALGAKIDEADFKGATDCEYYQSLNPDWTGEPEVDWAAAEEQAKRMAGL